MQFGELQLGAGHDHFLALDAPSRNPRGPDEAPLPSLHCGFLRQPHFTQVLAGCRHTGILAGTSIAHERRRQGMGRWEGGQGVGGSLPLFLLF